MKNKGINALFLQKGIAVHIVLVISSIAVGIAWAYFKNSLQDTTQLIGTCIIIIFDMEIVRLILLWFDKLNKKYGQKFIETSSIKRIDRVDKSDRAIIFLSPFYSNKHTWSDIMGNWFTLGKRLGFSRLHEDFY